MAMIDYGALLYIDGKLANRNQFFMECSDTGYVCKTALNKNEEKEDIDGNYFVYAGDEELLLVFYKGLCKVISNGRILFSFWRFPFLSETIYINDEVHLKVSKLHKGYRRDRAESGGTLKEFILNNWKDCDGTEQLKDLENGRRIYKKHLRHGKRVHYLNTRDKSYKYYPYRFLAEWDYKGKHYKVIFGYGIEPDEEVWHDIKANHYDFFLDEIQKIDSWFESEDYTNKKEHK